MRRDGAPLQQDSPSLVHRACAVANTHPVPRQERESARQNHRPRGRCRCAPTCKPKAKRTYRARRRVVAGRARQGRPRRRAVRCDRRLARRVAARLVCPTPPISGRPLLRLTEMPQPPVATPHLAAAPRRHAKTARSRHCHPPRPSPDWPLDQSPGCPPQFAPKPQAPPPEWHRKRWLVWYW